MCSDFAQKHSLHQWAHQIEAAVESYQNGDPWPLYSATLPQMTQLMYGRPSSVFVLGPGANFAELAVVAMVLQDANVYGIDSSPPRSYRRMIPRRIGNGRIAFFSDDYAIHKGEILDSIQRSGDKITNPHLIARHPPVLTNPSDLGEAVLDGLAQWASYIADIGGSFVLTTYTKEEMNRVSSRILSALPVDYIERLRVIEHPRGGSPTVQVANGVEIRIDGWRMVYPDAVRQNQVGRVYP